MDDGKNTTLWFIGGFVVLAIVGVIIAYFASGGATGESATNASSTFVATTAHAITATDWKEGNQDAKVSVVEYGDFECPACGEYESIMEQLVGAYSSTVLFVFRNYPLYTIHPDAGISSQAAEAAGLQGKYWQMHDLLYKDQAQWVSDAPGSVAKDYFDGYASSLGLDVNKFNVDISSNAVMTKIQNDVNGGNSAQINHTPTFFVNLVQIPNPTGLSDFEATLNQALAAAGVSASTTGQ